MSRVGRKPIELLEKVKGRLEGRTLWVEGPKGKLNTTLPAGVDVLLTEKQILIKRENEDQSTVALHGMVRALVHNMVVGVSKGFTKELEIIGVGYKAEAKGRELLLQLGFSHPVVFPLPEGIEAKVDKQTKIMIAGCSRYLVGEVAAEIRDLRPPEPYKGKGIRYVGEYVRQKVGKAAATASGG